MRREPTAEPFVPSAKRLAVQCFWYAVLLWPLTVAVAVVVIRMVL